MKKPIYIGADHAGFQLKEQLKQKLSKKYQVIDCGNTCYDSEDDYPDFAAIVAKKVAATRTQGILICGSAEGMSIAANKIKGIRAVVVHDFREAKLTRQHNNANILCLSGWKLTPQKAYKLAVTWLKTSFSKAARHQRRVRKIIAFERQ